MKLIVINNNDIKWWRVKRFILKLFVRYWNYRRTRAKTEGLRAYYFGLEQGVLAFINTVEKNDFPIIIDESYTKKESDRIYNYFFQQSLYKGEDEPLRKH